MGTRQCVASWRFSGFDRIEIEWEKKYKIHLKRVGRLKKIFILKKTTEITNFSRIRDATMDDFYGVTGTSGRARRDFVRVLLHILKKKRSAVRWNARNFFS